MNYMPKFDKESFFNKDTFNILFLIFGYLVSIGCAAFGIFGLTESIAPLDYFIFGFFVSIGVGFFGFTLYFTYFFVAINRIQNLCEQLKNEEKVDELLTLIDKGRFIELPINSLGELEKKARKAVPKLIGLLNHRRDLVRNNCAVALGLIKHKDAIPHLLDIVKTDSNVDVRTTALFSLDHISPKVFRDNLSDILDTVRKIDDFDDFVLFLINLCILDVQEVEPIVQSKINNTNNDNELFLYHFCLTLLHGINSDSMQTMDEIYTYGKLKRRKKKGRYLRQCRYLIFREKNKKRKRKPKTELEHVMSKSELHKEEIIGAIQTNMKQQNVNQKHKFRQNLLLAIITPIIAGIFMIIGIVLTFK